MCKRKGLKWLNNAISADLNGVAGECPLCGSINTGYVIVQNPAFIEVWCNICKKFRNMSYNGAPKPNRNVMTGDQYKEWKKTQNFQPSL